jgi:hypothetical protein
MQSNPSRLMANHSEAVSNYVRNWRDLRRRQYLFWIVVLSFVPAVLLSILIVNLLGSDVPQYFGAAIGAAWLAAYVAADCYLHHFRCPRCQGLFHIGYVGQIARCCMHCRLANGTPAFADKASSESAHEAAEQPHS